MSTQGLVSIVDQEGRVLYKLITGADGFNAPEVARRAPLIIAAGGGALELREMAIEVGFGADDSESFVVQDRERDYGPAGEDWFDELPASYREHFGDPRWNPRWRHGTAEYTEVVQVDLSAGPPRLPLVVTEPGKMIKVRIP
jgi:hypothetical protein